MLEWQRLGKLTHSGEPHRQILRKRANQIDTAAWCQMAGNPEDNQAPPPYVPGVGQGVVSPLAGVPASAHTSGPTPITTYYPVGAPGNRATPTVVFLPYYDPRSPHSMEAARRRARRRFIGALLWAFTIYAVVGFVTGRIVVDIKRYHRHS